MGVSRTPLREALRILGREGLLKLIRNKGAYIAKPSLEEIGPFFSSAREGLLPRALARTRPNEKIPRNAIIACTLASGAVAVMHYIGSVSESLLFELAGIGFLMSYALAVSAYIKRLSQIAATIFCIGTFGGYLLLLSTSEPR